MTENFMVINGERFRVINAWTETEASDGRKRWGIVTEPMVPDDAPAPLSITQCPGGAPCPLRAAWPKAETQGRWGADPEPAPWETEEQPAAPAGATFPARVTAHLEASDGLIRVMAVIPPQHGPTADVYVDTLGGAERETVARVLHAIAHQLGHEG